MPLPSSLSDYLAVFVGAVLGILLGWHLARRDRWWARPKSK